MISVLLTVGAVAIVGIVVPLFSLASEKRSPYGSQLEEYIVSQNPRDVADVERHTLEYGRKNKQGYL